MQVYCTLSVITDKLRQKNLGPIGDLIVVMGGGEDRGVLAGLIKVTLQKS